MTNVLQLTSKTTVYMKSKILLADDDRIILAMHQAILKLSNLDLDVQAFEDGEPLLDFLLNKSDPYTHYIILLDLNLPKVSGFDVLVELEALKEKVFTSVIVVSSSDHQYDKIRSMDFKFVKEYITKPFRIGYLAKIEALINHELKKKLSA